MRKRRCRGWLSYRVFIFCRSEGIDDSIFYLILSIIYDFRGGIYESRVQLAAEDGNGWVSNTNAVIDFILDFGRLNCWWDLIWTMPLGLTSRKTMLNCNSRNAFPRVLIDKYPLLAYLRYKHLYVTKQQTGMLMRIGGFMP